jgi:3'(2'), 5'-bisphosphate nucleotidase
MQELLRISIKAALKAGKAIMDIYESDDFGVETKKDDSPLTKADLAAHEIILSYLKETNIPVLSEEGKNISYNERKNWKQLWIVDPIDGTKEFIKRNGEFTVNIALVENQISVMGVIYCPALNTLYYGNKNGAFKVENISEDNLEKQLNNTISMPIDSKRLAQNTLKTVVASKSHLSPETEAFINELKEKYGEVKTISKGSSLKLCMVAEGAADFYPRFAPTMEWDTAAGQAICEAAGCDVIDQDTKKTMLYNREELLNKWFLVERGK